MYTVLRNTHVVALAMSAPTTEGNGEKKMTEATATRRRRKLDILINYVQWRLPSVPQQNRDHNDEAIEGDVEDDDDEDGERRRHRY